MPLGKLTGCCDDETVDLGGLLCEALMVQMVRPTSTATTARLANVPYRSLRDDGSSCGRELRVTISMTFAALRLANSLAASELSGSR